jgi:cytochrome c-type biogenesis protein CcmH
VRRRGAAPIVLAVVLAASSLAPAAAPAVGQLAEGSGGARSAAPAAPSLDEAAILGPPAGRPLEGAELDAATRALGERMRCPVCQGMSIADSPSASALAMVSQVRDLLARGYTEKQVLDYFVRSYGEFVLLQPTAKGFNLVVWLAPLLGVVVGVALIALRLRAARRRRAAAPGAEPALAGAERGGRDDEEGDLERYVERVRSEVSS